MVHDELRAAAPGSIVVALKDGTVRVDDPDVPQPPFQRRERPVAHFVRTMALISEADVRMRIESGLRKVARDR